MPRVRCCVLLRAPLALRRAGARRPPRSSGRRSSTDGNLTFTRLIYGSGLRNFGFGGAAWSHDYPAADKNLSAIIDYITHIRVRLDGTNVLDLDDPEIFQNPVLYVWEPGYWTIQPSEAKRLREYLLKGGFVIFDDFEGPDHWDNMAAQMRQALPEHQFIRIDERHPIFHSFYDIRKLDVPHPSMDVPPGYFAMFENNDPSRPDDRARQSQQRHRRILGVVGRRPLQSRSHQQRLSARRELLRLRADTLKFLRFDIQGSPTLDTTAVQVR